MWFKTLSRVVVIVLCVAQLACSPEFNWRTTSVVNHQDKMTVLFPDVPVKVKKYINTTPYSGELSLMAVQKNTAQLALGYMAVKQPLLAEAVANSFADSFSKKIHVPAVRTTVHIPNTRGAFEITYPNYVSNGVSHTAKARFIWTDNATYQLLAFGRVDDLSVEMADMFLSSLVVIKP
jgi:hypothetical protein